MIKKLFQFLKEQEPITDIVGQRIFPVQLPRNCQLPALVIHQLTSDHEHHLTGKVGSAIGRVRVSIFARNHGIAVDATEAHRSVLQGFMGMMGEAEIDFVTLESINHISQQPIDGSDEWIFAIHSDYSIKYHE